MRDVIGMGWWHYFKAVFALLMGVCPWAPILLGLMSDIPAEEKFILGYFIVYSSIILIHLTHSIACGTSLKDYVKNRPYWRIYDEKSDVLSPEARMALWKNVYPAEEDPNTGLWKYYLESRPGDLNKEEKKILKEAGEEGIKEFRMVFCRYSPDELYSSEFSLTNGAPGWHESGLFPVRIIKAQICEVASEAREKLPKTLIWTKCRPDSIHYLWLFALAFFPIFGWVWLIRAWWRGRRTPYAVMDKPKWTLEGPILMTHWYQIGELLERLRQCPVLPSGAVPMDRLLPEGREAPEEPLEERRGLLE